MGDMKIDQAIISSLEPDSKPGISGCELIAATENVDSDMANQLCHWSPARGELASNRNESINYFHLDCGKVAIARSTFGQLEAQEFDRENQKASRVPARKIISQVAILKPFQLGGYGNNPALLARYLCATGYLSLPLNLPELLGSNNPLPCLEIADESFLDPAPLDRNDWELATNGLPQNENIARALEIHERVAIIGANDPLDFLSKYFASIPQANRWQTSFATGLLHSPDRPFGLQFHTAGETYDLRTITLKHAVQTVP